MARKPDSKDPEILDTQNTDAPLFDRPDAGEEWQEELDFYAPGNPHALVNLLPDKVREAVKRIPVNYLTMEERKLQVEANAGETERLLRTSFWEEYTLATDNKRNMSIDKVYTGACSREFFYRYIVANPLKLAYLVRPMKAYMLRMKELLDLAQDQMREIMLLPILDKKGVPNTKLIAEKVKIMILTENRVKGTVVQKIATQSKNLHVHTNADGKLETVDVEAEIASVESQLAKLRGETRTLTLDVNPKEGEDGSGIKASASR